MKKTIKKIKKILKAIVTWVRIPSGIIDRDTFTLNR